MLNRYSISLSPLSHPIDSVVPALCLSALYLLRTVSRAVIVYSDSSNIKGIIGNSTRYGEFDSSLLSKAKGNRNTLGLEFVPIGTSLL